MQQPSYVLRGMLLTIQDYKEDIQPIIIYTEVKVTKIQNIHGYFIIILTKMRETFLTIILRMRNIGGVHFDSPKNYSPLRQHSCKFSCLDGRR